MVRGASVKCPVTVQLDKAGSRRHGPVDRISVLLRSVHSVNIWKILVSSASPVSFDLRGVYEDAISHAAIASSSASLNRRCWTATTTGEACSGGHWKRTYLNSVQMSKWVLSLLGILRRDGRLHAASRGSRTTAHQAIWLQNDDAVVGWVKRCVSSRQRSPSMPC